MQRKLKRLGRRCNHTFWKDSAADTARALRTSIAFWCSRGSNRRRTASSFFDDSNCARICMAQKRLLLSDASSCLTVWQQCASTAS